MKNKANQICQELDKKLDIWAYSEEEAIDIILKIGEENNLPKKDIADYITVNIILDSIVSFTGNKKEVYELIKEIVDE